MSSAINHEFGYAVPQCNTLHFPNQYKIKQQYMLVNPGNFGGMLPDGAYPPIAPVVFDEATGETQVLRPARNALGDSAWTMHVEYRENGSRIYKDVSYGPALRLREENAKHVAGYLRGDTPVIGAPCVVRFYYDENDEVIARLKLNDVLRPRNLSDIDNVLVLYSTTGDRRPIESWGWGTYNDGTDRWVHVVYEAHTGRMMRMEKDDGCVQFYSGERGRECLRFSTHDPTKSVAYKGDGTALTGYVSEAYKGSTGRAYLVRRTFEDGTVNYYGGTEPGHTKLRRQWLPDGRVRYYKGDRFKEYVVREAFCPRRAGDTDAVLPEDVSVPTEPEVLEVPALAFPVGSRVRSHSLSRNDLNNRLGEVVDYKEDTGRFAVRFGGDKRKTFSIKPGNLVIEAQFQEDKAFPVGSKVRPHSLSRNDLNNRLGEVVEYKEDTGRFAVCFGGDERETFNIKPENLVTEAQFQEDRAARRANRTAAQRARDDHRTAERLERQQVCEAAARAAAALAATEAAVFDPSIAGPVAPPTTKQSVRGMLLCPVSREPMLDAVLASDGHVYSAKALHAYWEEHGFVSPLTGEAINAVLLDHVWIRSVARDMADTPKSTAWTTVPAEEPDLVCCPITQEIMANPVRASDGNVYDRDSLEQWFATGKQTSPLTNMPMAVEMREDRTMAVLCSAWA